MIDVDELRERLNNTFEPGKEDLLLDYLITIIRSDVIKIVSDINTIAIEESVTDNLYYLYVKSIVSESDTNILNIVDLYNDFTTDRKLEGITVDLKKDELLNNEWSGPIVTPIFADEDV